jgi:hypothetical protein
MTSPTHAVAERWIADHAGRGTVVMLESDWLKVNDTRVVVRRVPDLRAVLDGGTARLAGTQWLVVPEPLFGHPALQHLSLAGQVHAGSGFGGALGYDYDIYAVPPFPESTASR